MKGCVSECVFVHICIRLCVRGREKWVAEMGSSSSGMQLSKTSKCSSLNPSNMALNEKK